MDKCDRCGKESVTLTELRIGQRVCETCRAEIDAAKTEDLTPKGSVIEGLQRAGKVWVDNPVRLIRPDDVHGCFIACLSLGLGLIALGGFAAGFLGLISDHVRFHDDNAIGAVANAVDRLTMSLGWVVGLLAVIAIFVLRIVTLARAGKIP